mgnify:CR=1 FL=1
MGDRCRNLLFSQKFKTYNRRYVRAASRERRFPRLEKRELPVPTLKSSKKTQRQARRRRIRNKGVMSTMRGAIKSVRQAPDVETARTALTSAVSIIDRTVSKGVLHANTGSRYKSRLTHLVRKLG